MRILHDRHEYGTPTSTLKVLKYCQKGTIMNIWESMYIQAYGQQDLLAPEQSSADHNPLFTLTRILRHYDTAVDRAVVTLQPMTEYHNTANRHENGSCTIQGKSNLRHKIIHVKRIRV
jgi:hypothetical protein